MEEKKYKQNSEMYLATFKDIALHAVSLRAFKFTHLMFKKLFLVKGRERVHYCHVGPKISHHRSNVHRQIPSLLTRSQTK